MKRFLLVAMVAVVLAACGGGENSTLSAEETVEVCWQRVNEGDWSGAVSLMDVAKDEADIFAESLAEACEPLRAEGEVVYETLEVVVEGENATITGRLTLADGTSSDSVYHLISRDGVWLIAE